MMKLVWHGAARACGLLPLVFLATPAHAQQTLPYLGYNLSGTAGQTGTTRSCEGLLYGPVDGECPVDDAGSGHDGTSGSPGGAATGTIDNLAIVGGGTAPILEVISNGGAGGQGGDSMPGFGFAWENGGDGQAGSAGGAITLTLNSQQLSSSASGVASIVFTANGGQGGAGGLATGSYGSSGANGTGGAGGDITIVQSAYFPVVSQAAGTAAYAITSNGGDGGGNSDASATTSSDHAYGQQGGDGGGGGGINLTIYERVVSAGAGIVALSQGGDGSYGAYATSDGSSGATAGAGGAGGQGGDITVALDLAASQVTGTYGAASIVAVGSASSVPINLPSSGDGSSPALIEVTSAGVLAQSVGGSGGYGGSADGFFGPGHGGPGGDAGGGGGIDLTSTGTVISTSGFAAPGLVAQSIGGSGGNGAPAGSVFSPHGGNGGAGGFGNIVIVGIDQGSITTTGEDSEAIVAQSIGGGGGYGADVQVGGIGATVALGGNGENGGNGNIVEVTNGSTSNGTTGGALVTQGDNSAAILAQSIGGGGGRGGSASAVDFGVLAMTIGGQAGSGGIGSFVIVENQGAIRTSGSHSAAIIAQSIGGGGGAGGGANSYDIGAQVTTAIAVGGNGGSGGDGGIVTVANDGDAAPTITTEGSDSYGILAQSIGGGGGSGGGSLAEAYQLVNDEETPSLNMTATLGGQGGTAGDGNDVTVTNSGAVLTWGAGSIAIVAQSIGGGGGTGGDSGAFNQSYESSWVNVTTTVGGSGGGGGAGGNVTVTSSGMILTLGEAASGIVAQSIGGGGGNGGYGVANTGSYTNQEGYSLQATVALGGTGGTGGNGGDVIVNNLLGGILTTGDASAGIFAQSVGGGGGNGSYATADGSGGAINVNLGIGGNGGGAGDGGTVTIVNTGAILTKGGGSAAIYAQSIGGSGGKGGKAATGSGTDPEVSIADFLASGMGIGANVIDAGNGAYTFKDNISGDFSAYSELQSIAQAYVTQNDEAPEPEEDEDSDSDITLDVGAGYGGNGGNAGAGGNVTVTNSGDIGTQGPASEGIFAESIGGGGGDGGIVIASSSNGEVANSSVTGSIALGSTGGSAGDGGVVTVGNSAHIATDGDLSYGILAMSIGGGGGKAGVTTANQAILSNLDLAIGGSGGSNGNGNTVTVTQDGWIDTSGDDAAGIVAQSIGGGGGLLTLMSLTPNGDGTAESHTGTELQMGLPPLTVSGSPNVWSYGGTVAVTLGDAPQASATPSIVTSGRDAYGILAQSVGGGGGLVVGASSGSSAATLATLFTDGGNNGDGGTVAVELENAGWIYTSGTGAVGVLAQSIGGGGGLFGGMSDVTLDQGLLDTPNPQSGQGGNVTVDLESGGNIVTTGAKAHGIFAQSVGGGGGIISQSDGNGYAFSAADPYTNCSGQGCTGTVTVTLGWNTVVRAEGEDAYAIFVQSRGNGVNDTVVNVNQNGWVESWGQSAGGIYLDGAGSNTVNNYGTIDDGTLNGAPTPSGIAITGSSTAAANATVNNFAGGTINGTIVLPGGTINNSGTINGSVNGAQAVNNQLGGTFNLRGDSDLAGGRFVNQGTVAVGESGQTSSVKLAGDFVLNAGGTLVLDADHVAGTADLLEIAGTATLEGTIRINAITLSKTPVTVLQVDSPEATSLLGSVADLVVGSHLFGYSGSVVGSTLQVQAQANFKGDNASLNAPQRDVADYLQRVWDKDDAGALGEGFARLAREVTDPGSYADALDGLSGQTANAIGALQPQASLDFVSQMYSCPAFDGPGLLLREHDCGWGRVLVDGTSLGSDGDTAGFDQTRTALQVGAQKEVAEGWFLGGSFGYAWSTLDGGAGAGSVEGDSVAGGLVVKRQLDQWLFALAADGGVGWYDSERVLTLDGDSDQASASFDTQYAGLHGRVAYELPFETWYLKPYLDLHGLYARTGSYSESGAGVFDLDVDSEDAFRFAGSPMLEAGTRIDVGPKTTVRLSAAAGGLFFNDNSWGAEARFAGAPDGAGSFSADTVLPKALGQVVVGAQVLSGMGIDIKLEYSGAYSDGYASNAGSLKFDYRF